MLEGRFVFDTRYPGSTICPRIARQLKNSDDSSLALTEGVNKRSMGGTLTLDWIKIGPNQADNFTVPIIAIENYDGILGSNLLDGFRFQIDNDARRIRWR